MNSEKRMSIGILTFPIGEAGITPLTDLVNILEPISRVTHLITGGEGYDVFSKNGRIRTCQVTHRAESKVLLRIARYLVMQVEMSCHLARIGRGVDVWVFFIGGDTLILPMLLAKVLNRKVVITFASSSSMILRSTGDRLSNLNKMVSQINCTLANRIVLYSSRLISEWEMARHNKKVVVAKHHVPDFQSFNIRKEFASRNKLVGYVGRLSEEKGVLQFIRAIPAAIKRDPELAFIVAGDGSLKDDINQYVNRLRLGKMVRMTGWIPHSELPSFLNELRLVVIPSYTEGLPNVMLEAMACGTPVLATGVGAIPDVIEDGETGFILADNSSGTISASIIDVLSSPRLHEVSENALEFVRREFKFEESVQGWRNVLGRIDQQL